MNVPSPQRTRPWVDRAFAQVISPGVAPSKRQCDGLRRFVFVKPPSSRGRNPQA